MSQDVDAPRLVCLGASAGGLAPVRQIVAALPADLPAAVFVVIHMSPDAPSQLAPILQRSSPMEAAEARDGEQIRAGRIYVPRPDCHLLIEDSKVRLTRGPRENRHRPSIDNLFRSAARFGGNRSIGVVVSGSLDDGTAGLIAIQRRGGVTIVQEPSEALAPDMPRNALRYLDVDHVAHAGEIGPLIERIARSEIDESGTSIRSRTVSRADSRRQKAHDSPARYASRHAERLR